MKISVIGASGNVGSCAAFTIAVQRLADEMVLIDLPRKDMVTLHAMDIATAVTGKDVLVRAGGFEDMTGSDIVIVAAGSAEMVNSRMDVLAPNLPIIQDVSRKLRQFCPDAIVITASNPVCPLNYAMYRCSGLDRSKAIGYSYNDTLRFRMRLAGALGVASSRVSGYVIGEHGDSQVLLFSTARIDGRPVSFSDETKRELRQQVPDGQKLLDDLRKKTGRTAAWTTATGLAEVCRAIVQDTGATIPCSLALDGEYGCRNMSMSVPAVLGKGGAIKIIELPLSPDERELLDRSIEVLKPAMKYVEEFLHLC
ncbi:MAG: hypothetical protein ABR886_10540 [Dehalococcoidales bacterium]